MIGILRSQLYRFWHRRRYVEVVDFKVRRNAEVIQSRFFPSEPVYSGDLLLAPSNIREITRCSKSGSWTKSPFSIGRPFHWTSQPRPYFYEIDEKTISLAANPYLIKSVQLQRLFNCEVSKDERSSLSLNIYSARINESKSFTQFEDAIYLAVSGAESFQHFIQDCLPIASFLKSFPELTQQIPVIMLKPRTTFLSPERYLKQIGLNNEILFLDSSTSLRIKTLYFLNFQPFNATYSLPPKLYEDSYREFHSSSKHSSEKADYVILIDRKEKVRNFSDVSLVKNALESWCNHHSLVLKVIDTKTCSLEEIQNYFSRAKYVFSIHGGANYNMIWAPLDATLIEFIPSDATDSLYHLIRSYGQTYFPYALPHNKGDTTFDVSNHDMQTIFELLDARNRNSNARL